MPDRGSGRRGAKPEPDPDSSFKVPAPKTFGVAARRGPAAPKRPAGSDEEDANDGDEDAEGTKGGNVDGARAGAKKRKTKAGADGGDATAVDDPDADASPQFPAFDRVAWRGSLRELELDVFHVREH